GIVPLALPTDYPRPPIQTYRGARQHLLLPLDLSQQVEALAQREGVTLFMLLLAAFQVLLSRYCGQEDIAVGTPIANRTQQETEGLIGCFINALVLRTDLSGDPSFTELLERVRAVALGAYMHQDVPFEQVVEALQPQRDQSRPPLYQVVFALQNTPEVVIEQTRLRIERFVFEQNTAEFELRMGVTQSAQGLSTTLEYNTDLFEDSTIQRILSHWETILQGIVARPEQRLSRLSLLGEAERKQVLFDWNATQHAMPQKTTLHQLFEQQVQRTPDIVALISEEHCLTYAHLNQRANQLAHLLRISGVGPDVLIGLSVERSPEMIIGLLGILKAGGAYVPLDPNYPPDRYQFILQDTQIFMLLTRQHLLTQLPIGDISALCLDIDWSTIARLPAEDLPPLSSAEHLAYIIYTSGSTGKPKGVLVEHRNVCPVLIDSIETFELGNDERVMQCASLSFDVSVLEIFMTLLTGSTLCLLSSTNAVSGEELAFQLRYQAITAVGLTPPHLETLPIDGLDDLRMIMTGGESCPLSTVSRCSAGRRFYVAYGVTETAIQTTVQKMLEPYPQGTPIGRPLASVQAYLLDAQGDPVPVGIAGELYIGGAGLTRGYLHASEQTAERFVPHPFSLEAGARLYRTGDLARYRADGTIEFIGRQDNQVKLRGFRIEPGEIETMLDRHPQVQQSVVLLQGEESSEKRLVAYVAVKQGIGVTSDSQGELRSFLKSMLPDHMVPAHFVLLDMLPLTANGKVDRRSLSTLNWKEEEQQDGEEFGETLSPIEELVMQCWKQILQVDHLSVQDNFFEQGGHSLLVTQMVAHLRHLLGIEVPLQAVFEAPTIVDLSVFLQEELRQDQGLPVPTIVPVSRNQDLPLSFAQQRLWFLDQLEPGSTAYTVPVAVRLYGQLKRTALEQALTRIIQRHETLRTTFPSKEGRPVQQIAPAPLTQLVVLDLSCLPQQERESATRRLVQQEVEQPFDLGRGPLLRTWLITLAQNDQVLMLTMHHIVSDGWSMGVLVRELTTLYQAMLRGEEAVLPALPLQYADYAVWQREWLQGEVLQQQLDYWKQHLADIVPLELPIDHPRPPIITYQGAHMYRQLSPELTQQLHELAQREGVTLFMLLLAAFQVLLSRYSGQQDIAVGTPIANRSYQEIEGLIGFFVNTLVLRTDLSGDPSFVELLERVRTVALGAYAHQEVPFEQVVDALQLQRDQSRSPLFQVLFALQNTPRTTARQIGLQMEGFSFEQNSAKFELSMVLTQSSQGLGITMEYNTDLFEEVTIARWLTHWQRLLEEIVVVPERPLSSLSLLTSAEREQLLVAWNTTGIDVPGDSSALQLFEAQAQRVPDTVALTCEESQLTYAALEQRANQMAHYLCARGVGPEVPVGILVERSLEMVIGLLAALKAGGAYVPMDPSYPVERLAFMISDSGMPILLTQQDLISSVSSASVELVCIDEIWPQIGQASTLSPGRPFSADMLAYVIYTSGSTGVPKGVAVEHHALTNLLYWHQRAFTVTSSDRATHLAGLGFDATVWELWPYLTIGASISLLDEETRRMPEQL
ncbi:MAG TPA: amino acid adenylation domain-containing protein, partial [Ktedonobacteraceae bacterium]|nr:amino acid adenylation domain-containing protein [Ktedonobacteraceae bacterium]